MELSREDSDRLERIGYRREEFAIVGRDDVARLRNVGEWCFFYDTSAERCRVYVDRPLGCHIYPAMYSENDGTIVIDELCPMAGTISEKELKARGRILITLLMTIDEEARLRSRSRPKRSARLDNSRKSGHQLNQ
jgi:Fe-S-cluster containining protein